MTTLVKNEKVRYYVGSQSEEPMEIMFSHAQANASGYVYLDGFDDNGKRVASYKLVDGDYTDFF